MKIISRFVALESILYTFSGIFIGKSDYSSDFSCYVMLAGRFIYAIASETMGNAMYKLINDWFPRNLSSLFFISVLCSLSFIFSLILSCTDKKVGK